MYCHREFEIDDPTYDIDLIDEFVERAMQRTRKKALNTISSRLQIDSVSNEALIAMFVYSWQESLPTALNLAEKLNLKLLDFLALDQDFDAYKDIYINEKREDLSYYEI